MIRIVRENLNNSQLSTAYKIFIDGVCHGKIKMDETKEFEVERGWHTVWIKSGWWRSNKLRMNVSDSIVELEIGCNAKVDNSKSMERLFLEEIIFWDQFLWIRHKKKPT